MPSLQFGFCKALGACDAILTITNHIQRTLVGLDFNADYGHISYNALTLKHRQLDVGGLFLNINVI